MIVLFTMAILSVSALGNNAYANHIAGAGSTLDVVAAEGSDTINVSGITDRSDEIIIKVIAPNRNLVSVDQITPSGGSYATTIFTGGPLWSQDGTYTIKARQGPTNFNTSAVNVQGTQTGGSDTTNTGTSHKSADDENTGLLLYQASAEIEILDGHVIPEFGVIAAMILAVAIVSIIVVTAKTKLSIVPRY